MTDTQQHELTAWLGPATDELTQDQIRRLVDEFHDIDERYPDHDEADKREAALSATVQYLLGETTPEDIARSLLQARLGEREAFVAAEQFAVMLHRDGTPKAAAARMVGIDRMSLLKALGER